MCGIAGSSNFKKAFELYQSNLNRGYYSSGALIVKNSAQCTRKSLGIFEHALIGQPGSQADYYLYHSRGPTTETTSFIEDNNHPFVYNNWTIAHNGIISNFKQLGEKYFPQEDFTGKTDSCIIPRLLSIKPMKEALEELKGTFALWMWSPVSEGVYICRSGVTLFMNTETGDFCSTEFEGSEPVEEGHVYKINNYRNITKCLSFKSVSPYFIL